jgi:hypothetical protein
MGGADSVTAAVDDLEEWRVANTFLSELTRARGAKAVARRALRSRQKGSTKRVTPATPAGNGRRAEDEPDLVVCPSGNLALVYFPDIPGRADLETLNATFPDMVEALANHPGVGLLMVRSSEHGALVVGQSGVRNLADDKVEGEDPLAAFGPHARPALKRLDAMGNCGDLVLISMLDPNTHQVAAFEELIGSHGGIGGPQTEPLILYPTEWKLAAKHLVGAPAVHDQLRKWLSTSASTPMPEPLAESLEEAAA